MIDNSCNDKHTFNHDLWLPKLEIDNPRENHHALSQAKDS